MRTSELFRVGLSAFFVCLAGCDREVSFAEDVQPILMGNCTSCHDEAAEGYAASGLSLLDYESLMSGTRYGPVVDPGSSESSALYMVVAHKTDPQIHMPPHHENAMAAARNLPLSERQVETIKTWIDQGAKNN